jgi:rhodanese-related sulfurtransferase
VQYLQEQWESDMEDGKFRNLTSDELREYMRKHQEKDYLLVDVRQPKEYREGHIAGAHLLPLGELSARLSELPVDRDVIFY